MIRRYVVVPGTGSLCSDPTPPPHPNHYWEPGSPLELYFKPFGLLPVEMEPFEWDGDLDGHWGWLPWNWFGAKEHRDWRGAGSSLRYYLQHIEFHNRNLIAHSHGLQVVLYAAAGTSWRQPVPIRRLVSVGSPVREDMMTTARKARVNIQKWIHIYDPTGKDDIQIWGELGDGKVGRVRPHPLADMSFGIANIGHSEILRVPSQFHHWREHGLIEFLKS